MRSLHSCDLGYQNRDVSNVVISHVVCPVPLRFIMLSQDLAVITAADFQVLLDELLAYEAVGKLDAIVA